MVSAVHFRKSLHQDDLGYLVNVMEGNEHVNTVHSEPVEHDADLQTFLDSFKDVFPD